MEQVVIEKGIPPNSFYCGPSALQVKIEASLRKSSKETKLQSKNLPAFLSNLLGPSRTWKVFRKQQDALDCALKRRNGLMCFTFEQSDGVRLFLVAHPQMFWHVYSTRPERDKSSYEIIQEHATCKLYFDFEFDYEFNTNVNGDIMLANFLTIVNMKLWECFKIKCNEEHILDLDSSNNEKFSHHVIYQMPDVAFIDNHSAGNFVKMICTDLRDAVCNLSEEKIKAIAIKCNITPHDIRNMFVLNRHKKVQLFCDECVYTKNRHFRLLGSSKVKKNRPLVLSKSNEFKQNLDKNCLEIFLDSLITYFPHVVGKVLEFGLPSTKPTSLGLIQNQNQHQVRSPSYPCLDSFIKSLIGPIGEIRRKAFFSSSSCLVYDIQGYRYCENIQRHHKSNNIRIIVDLNSLVWFQKCYDPECNNFTSKFYSLPDVLKFQFSDDSLFNQDSYIDDLDLNIDFWKVIDTLDTPSVPDFGLSDGLLLKAVEESENKSF